MPSEFFLDHQHPAINGLHGKHNVRPDTPSAWLLWERVGIQLGVEAWRIEAASKVGLRETAVALLRVLPQVQGCASHRVASKHTETLGTMVSPIKVAH